MFILAKGVGSNRSLHMGWVRGVGSCELAHSAPRLQAGKLKANGVPQKEALSGNERRLEPQLLPPGPRGAELWDLLPLGGIAKKGPSLTDISYGVFILQFSIVSLSPITSF